MVYRSVAKLDPAVYDAYVGEREFAPGFVFAVTREGDRLMTQATDHVPHQGGRDMPAKRRR